MIHIQYFSMQQHLTLFGGALPLIFKNLIHEITRLFTMDLPFKPIEGSIVIYFGIHHKHDKLN